MKSKNPPNLYIMKLKIISQTLMPKHPVPKIFLTQTLSARHQLNQEHLKELTDFNILPGKKRTSEKCGTPRKI